MQHVFRNDHEQRGWDAFARHVRHRNRQTGFIQHVKIVKIAADFLGGRHGRIEVEGGLPRKIRRDAGEHPRLDFSCDGKLCGNALLFRCRPRQVLHIFLEIALHGVHAVRQVLDLVAGLDFQFLVEIAVGNFLDALGQRKNRANEMIGGFRPYPKDKAQKGKQQRRAARREAQEHIPEVVGEFLHMPAQAVPRITRRIVDLRLPDDLPKTPTQ